MPIDIAPVPYPFETADHLTHDVWSVTKAREGNYVWAAIGHGCQHDDGHGLTLMFTVPPIPGQYVVIRRLQGPRDGCEHYRWVEDPPT